MIVARRWSIVSSTLSGRVTQWIARNTQNRRVSSSNPTDALGQALGALGDLRVVLEVVL